MVSECVGHIDVNLCSLKKLPAFPRASQAITCTVITFAIGSERKRAN